MPRAAPVIRTRRPASEGVDRTRGRLEPDRASNDRHSSGVVTSAITGLGAKGGLMGFTDSHHFRKTVAGCCMVVGPLLALAAFIVSPALNSGSGAQVAEVA